MCQKCSLQKGIKENKDGRERREKMREMGSDDGMTRTSAVCPVSFVATPSGSKLPSLL